MEHLSRGGSSSELSFQGFGFASQDFHFGIQGIQINVFVSEFRFFFVVASLTKGSPFVVMVRYRREHLKSFGRSDFDEFFVYGDVW